MGVADVIAIITSNELGAIFAALLMLSGAFAQFAALTPWGWDDKAAGWMNKIFKVIAGNYGKAKSLPKE